MNVQNSFIQLNKKRKTQSLTISENTQTLAFQFAELNVKLTLILDRIDALEKILSEIFHEEETIQEEEDNEIDYVSDSEASCE